MVAASRSAAERAASERGRCMKPPIEPPFPADREKGSRLIGRAGEEKVQWHGKRMGHRRFADGDRPFPARVSEVRAKLVPGTPIDVWCQDEIAPIHDQRI